ncbi:glycosyltransferase family 2 protein [Terribacillus sp. 179-K 1B1 HS]|uniref:glycosyltransferase family 2 protein n=1 Tax=Terribacillus sp. 179-K 1B1 HS TaxID=3142388 RepID=UPI00399EEC80
MKYTIAVPVYNDESTIRTCLDSIVNQTIGTDKLEVICVNDGSTDDSPVILEEYSAAHSCIKVFHQENSGSPSGPRNRAIEAATGDFIFFIDGDDYFGLEAFERMEEKILAYNPDIVVGKYEGVNRGVPTAIFNRNPDNFQFFGSNALYSIGAVKLFRLDLLRKYKIRFPEHYSLGEDQAFMVKAYSYSSSIALVKDYPVYYATNHLTEGREQLTKQGIKGKSYMYAMTDTLQTIRELELPKEKKLMAYYQYIHRILHVELRAIIVRSFLMEDKAYIFNTLKALIKEHKFLEFYNFFNARQKLLLRLIEQGELEDLINFWYAESHPGNMQVFHGLVYPKSEKAYELAKAESLSFHRKNDMHAVVTRITKGAEGIILEGYNYHSHVDAEKEKMYLKLVNRKGETTTSIEMAKGPKDSESPVPIQSDILEKQQVMTFHAIIPFSVLHWLQTEDSIVDLHVVSRIEDYTITARIKGEVLSFPKIKGTLKEKRNKFVVAESYNTKHGNLSFKVSLANKPKPKQLSRKLRVKNKLKRIIQA